MIVSVGEVVELSEPSEPMLQFFERPQHLPRQLFEISQRFERLAETIGETLPRNPERTAALHKLLEAMDCAIRAALWRG